MPSKHKFSEKIRRIVEARANFCCEYCGSLQTVLGRLSIEHIYPECLGGSHDLINLALSCQHCNSFKSARTHFLDPVSGQKVPFFNPRTDKWQEHFKWENDFKTILGLTPTGRATILALRLNRENLIVYRTVTRICEMHPPENFR